MTGSSTQGVKAVLHPVWDLATATTVDAAPRGVPPQTDGPCHVGGGRLVATVTDPDRNVLRLLEGP